MCWGVDLIAVIQDNTSSVLGRGLIDVIQDNTSSVLGRGLD